MANIFYGEPNVLMQTSKTESILFITAFFLQTTSTYFVSITEIVLCCNLHEVTLVMLTNPLEIGHLDKVTGFS